MDFLRRTLTPKPGLCKEAGRAGLILIPLFLLVFAVLSAGPARAVEGVQRSLMSASDRTAIHQALQAVKRRDWNHARTLASRAKDPLARKVYDWLAYTRNPDPPDFARVSAFVRQNPGWPQMGKIRLAAEKAMPSDLPAAEVIAWFDAYKPLTPDGMEHYLQALLGSGMKDKAAANLREWWKSAQLEPDQQNSFLTRYGALIDRQSNVARFGWLMMRKQYTNGRATARQLGKGYPALAAARIALAEGAGNVDTILAAVPAHLQNDPGLLLERLRWRRRNGKEFAAIEILHNMPDPAIIPNPGEWWKEREIMVRELMSQKRYESAYLLAAAHQQKEGVPFAEAEFLAGWLALKVRKPWKAFEHFESLYGGTTTPLSRSRGAYWAGRASDALGHPEIARQWYRTAARYQTTFYGQIAIGRLADEYKPPQQLPPEKTVVGQQKFETLEMVQTVRILNGAGFRNETNAFLDALAEDVKSPEDYLLVADLANELDHRHNAVKIAKKGLQKGILLMDQAYPTILTRMKKVDMEWALVHALIRQESAFDEEAESPAGARGLMQLMPATAQGVAKKYNISHRTDWLTSNPDHNIRLGSLYIGQMLARFDNSYPLALAAYNAGPGRVDKWLAQYGDPRKGQVDMVDWIEMIPFEETRNYVQRVLEGVYIYRMKLNSVQKSFQAPIHVVQKP
jgi:soluble lytic murein transglycosylase